MKLLITTQKVDMDDDVLGFFHDWIIEFAKQYEEVRVVTLFEGRHNLPSNVLVYSLGKESGVSRFEYVKNFYRIIWRERKSYDQVFAHMNQVYVVLGGLLWRLWGKKIGLWYTHRATSLSLRIAEKFSHIIFTAVPQSFQVRSAKVHSVGHGIDASRFTFSPRELSETITILHMGRLTSIKNCDTAILAAEKLAERMPDKKIKLVFAGGPITDADYTYEEVLKELAQKINNVEIVFAGTPTFGDVPTFFRDADVTWNLTPTGGIDKAVLSGMAAARPTIVSNESFVPIFDSYANRLLATYRDPDDFAQKTYDLLAAHDRVDVLTFLQKKVVSDYSIPGVIKKIVTTLCAR